MMSENHELIDDLRFAIMDEDNEDTIEYLNELLEKVLMGDEGLMVAITTPSVITDLHNLLQEHLKVPQKLLMIKTRTSSRKKRAVLFISSMINGTERVS